MKQRFIKYAVTVCVLLMPLTAFAELTMSIKAEKEIAVVKNGKKELKRVKAKNFEPGATILYSIGSKNTGADVVTNPIIDDPFTKKTNQVTDRTSEPKSDITFSINTIRTAGTGGTCTGAMPLVPTSCTGRSCRSRYTPTSTVLASPARR